MFDEKESAQNNLLEEELINPQQVVTDATAEAEPKEDIKKSKKTPKPADGEFFEYDDDGGIKERLFFKDGKRNGEGRSYKKGVLTERKIYVDDILEGFVELYDNGIMKMNIKYSNNVPNGVGYFFHRSGYINAIAWYKEGLLEGPFLVFSEEGALVRRSSYKENKQHGATITYHPNGMIFESGQYKENQKDGTWVMKDATGKLMQTIVYNCGAAVSKKVEKD